MTISVNEITGVITVPESDTVLAGTDPITGREIRTYSTETLRLELRDWEDSVVGRDRPRTHIVSKESSVDGQPVARVFTILAAYYTVLFEDLGAKQYRVILQGNNNNVANVAVINGVSVSPTNSVGLTEPVPISTADFDEIENRVDSALTNAQPLAANITQVNGVAVTIGDFQTDISSLATSAELAQTETDILAAFGPLATTAQLTASETAIIAEIQQSESDVIAAIPSTPVDANIVQVNGTTVSGTGAEGDEWGPA